MGCLRWLRPRASRATRSWPVSMRSRRFDRTADEPVAPVTHMRRSDAGRKRSEVKDETLAADLLALVDPLTRNDPQSPLRWTCKSLRTLAGQCKGLSFTVRQVIANGNRRPSRYHRQAASPQLTQIVCLLELVLAPPYAPNPTIRLVVLSVTV